MERRLRSYRTQQRQRCPGAKTHGYALGRWQTLHTERTRNAGSPTAALRMYMPYSWSGGDKIASAFIVERGFEGFWGEEHKMGIKVLQQDSCISSGDCKVPVENLLGEVGRAAIIAFNILNIGRLKCIAYAIAGSKQCQFKPLNTQKQGAIPNTDRQRRHQIQTGRNGHPHLRKRRSALYRTGKWIDDKEVELAAEQAFAGNPAGRRRKNMPWNAPS